MLLNFLLTPTLLLNQYDDYIETDQDVMDCQFKLYILMMIDDDLEFKKRYKEFVESYKSLSIEKQEYIKRDFQKILEEKNINDKEKEKKYE